MLNIHVQKFLQQIGSKGGKKSRRVLTTEQSKQMIHIREEKKGRERKSKKR